MKQCICWKISVRRLQVFILRCIINSHIAYIYMERLMGFLWVTWVKIPKWLAKKGRSTNKPQSSYCWWFRNPVNSPVEVGGFIHVYSIIYKVLYIPGGDRRISEPSTVSMFFFGCLRIWRQTPWQIYPSSKTVRHPRKPKMMGFQKESLLYPPNTTLPRTKRPFFKGLWTTIIPYFFGLIKELPIFCWFQGSIFRP